MRNNNFVWNNYYINDLVSYKFGALRCRSSSQDVTILINVWEQWNAMVMGRQRIYFESLSDSTISIVPVDDLGPSRIRTYVNTMDIQSLRILHMPQISPFGVVSMRHYLINEHFKDHFESLMITHTHKGPQRILCCPSQPTNSRFASHFRLHNAHGMAL